MRHQVEQMSGVRESGHISPLLKTALLLGVFVHLAGFFLFRVVSVPLPSPQEDRPFVALVPAQMDGDKIELVEQASLFDSAPLFVPGEWSSASKVYASKVLRDWQVFPDYDPEINLLGEVRPDRLSLPQVAPVERPADLLNLRFWDMFDYFGEGGQQFETPEKWHSIAVARIVSSPESVSQGSEFQLEADFPVNVFAEGPIVFSVNMSAPGTMIGAPVLLQSSGSEDLDAAARDWLGQAEVLAQLPAGFLELRIYP